MDEFAFLKSNHFISTYYLQWRLLFVYLLFFFFGNVSIQRCLLPIGTFIKIVISYFVFVVLFVVNKIITENENVHKYCMLSLLLYVCKNSHII